MCMLLRNVVDFRIQIDEFLFGLVGFYLWLTYLVSGIEHLLSRDKFMES